MKSVSIRSYSGPHFPAFGLNTETYGVSLRIQSECGKIRIRVTPNTDTFYAVTVSKSLTHLRPIFNTATNMQEYGFLLTCIFTYKGRISVILSLHGKIRVSKNPNLAYFMQWYRNKPTLCEKCPYLGFFLYVFSDIWTKYEEILRISQYSVRMWKNSDEKNSKYGPFSCSAVDLHCNQLTGSSF